MSERHAIRAFWVYLIAAALIIGWIGVKTQITADRQESDSRQTLMFADQTRACMHDLLVVLNERNKINVAVDDVLQRRAQILADLIVEITDVETEQVHSDSDEWVTLKNKYVPLLLDTQRQQADLVRERDQHPIPAPNCPKS